MLKLKIASSEGKATFWYLYRQQIVFLTVFVLILATSFTLLSLNTINDRLVEPFTAVVAKTSGVVLNLLGQGIEMQGTIIRGATFAVNIKNGCNGVETMVIFLAAVLAFPTSWKSRAIGLAFGLPAIQLINLVRVVALFLTGAYFPNFFDSSHTVLWQTVVILFAVFLWISWADGYAQPAKGIAA